MSTTEVALTAHLVRPGAGLDDELLGRVCRDMQEKFSIGHVTVQIEFGRSGSRLPAGPGGSGLEVLAGA